jgi:predicted ATPase/DNA-binding SARP family transcriptional activator
MQVAMLGPLTVTVAGRAVEIGGARLRALLIRLALDAGNTVTVDSLSGAVWADDRPAGQANALQSLVSRLRRALPGDQVLRSLPGGYRLDLSPAAVDALRFERLAREGRHALHSSEPEMAVRRLREALALWRGEALAHVAEAPFAEAAAARLETLRLSAIEDRIEAEIEITPVLSDLVAELEGLVALYPLRERLRALLVKAFHVEGRTAKALTAYEDFRQRLADELGADPGSQLQAAQLAVLRGAKVTRRGPPLRPRTNLRAPLTSFVGRADEQARIARQLKRGRLVTLVGPGGAGKTRLATTLAADVADHIPGGVWLIELAAVTEAADVPRAVVEALGLRDAGLFDASTASSGSMNRLVEALSGAETLIVLDNCEHVIDAAARLVDELLGRCPRLQVLATSREPLGLLGEALSPVPPLGLPKTDSSLAEVLTCPSVRLFADRVAAFRPEFLITDDNMAMVADICARLDGLPLAIELAAARLRSMSLEELAARLNDRFRVLTGGSRTAMPRHQTLRAVVAWSWRLLNQHERLLAERLAVFPGDVTPEAAIGVCGGDAIEASEVCDLLATLVDKSLLQRTDGAGPRYRMLETIREYGLEQLAETGEIAQVRSAHVAYFLGLAEAAEPHLRGAGQLPWIERLRGERNNLMAALRYAADTGDAATAVRFGAALGLYWTVSGNHGEAAAWLRLALSTPGQDPPEPRTLANAFYLFNAVLSAGHSRSEVPVAEIREHLRRVEHPDAHPIIAMVEAGVALITNDTVAGLAAIDRRLPRADAWTAAMLCLMRAFVQGNDGDLVTTRRMLATTVKMFRQAGERWGLAMSLTAPAEADAILGDFDGVIHVLEEAVGLLHELNPADDAILQRTMLATARVQKGNFGQGRAELQVIVRPGEGTLSARYRVIARIALGNLARQDGDLAEAARQYEAADAELDRIAFSAPLFRAMIRAGMGHLVVARGELDRAAVHLDEALRLAVDAPDMPIAAAAAVGVARLRLRRGDPPGAVEVLGAAHALRGAPDEFNPDVVGLTEELRRELGDDAYQAAYAAGRELDRAEALALVAARLDRDQDR